jgi:hypothetical protein
MAFVGILKGTTSVNQSLGRSGDARIAAHYVLADARKAGRGSHPRDSHHGSGGGPYLGWRGSSGGTMGRFPVPVTNAQPK